MTDEPSRDMPPPYTDDEIRALARRMTENAIWSPANVEQEMLASVFLVLAMGGLKDYTPEQLNELWVYEDVAKAGSRSINGYPMFFSLRICLRADFTRATAMAAEMERAVDAIEVPPA